MIQNVMMSTGSVTQKLTYLWAQTRNFWKKYLASPSKQTVGTEQRWHYPVYICGSWLDETSPKETSGTEHAFRDLTYKLVQRHHTITSHQLPGSSTVNSQGNLTQSFPQGLILSNRPRESPTGILYIFHRSSIENSPRDNTQRPPSMTVI